MDEDATKALLEEVAESRQDEAVEIKKYLDALTERRRLTEEENEYRREWLKVNRERVQRMSIELTRAEAAEQLRLRERAEDIERRAIVDNEWAEHAKAAERHWQWLRNTIDDHHAERMAVEERIAKALEAMVALSPLSALQVKESCNGEHVP